MRRMLIALGCLAILVVAFLLWPLPRKCHNHFILPQDFEGLFASILQSLMDSVFHAIRMVTLSFKCPALVVFACGSKPFPKLLRIFSGVGKWSIYSVQLSVRFSK